MYAVDWLYTSTSMLTPLFAIGTCCRGWSLNLKLVVGMTGGPLHSAPPAPASPGPPAPAPPPSGIHSYRKLVDLKEKVDCILFFQIDRGKTASAARNLIYVAPQIDATTFAFASVSILLLICAKAYLYMTIFVCSPMEALKTAKIAIRVWIPTSWKIYYNKYKSF